MKILPILQANRYTTYEEIARQLGIERTTVWRNLDAMKKKGAIRRIGGDRGSEWVIF